MDDFIKCFIIGVIIIGVIITIRFIVTIISDPIYKEGHIQGLLGNVKYELVVHEDKTTTWELIEDKGETK